VEEKQIVSSIYSVSAFTRFPDIFTIAAVPKEGHPVEEIEEAIYDEIERLQTEGPSDWELERIDNQVEAGYVRALASNRGMAFRLADMQAITGDWSYFLKVKEKIMAVTADDVKRVLRDYFTEDNRTVAYIVKPEPDAGENAAMTKKYEKPAGVAK
jgi:predicted Zn-dependent peptidase